jgi:hypothetical protein
MEGWIKQLTVVLAEEIFSHQIKTSFLVNRNLLPEEKNCTINFEKWKAGKFAPDDVVGKEFLIVLNLH